MLTAAETARKLGVKPETLYAYVSRGMLTRHRAPDGRRSLFERAEVERLAARSRRGGRAGALEVVVDTELTFIDPAGALYYRGHDATVLARERTYEEVAELLWGTPDEPSTPGDERPPGGAGSPGARDDDASLGGAGSPPGRGAGPPGGAGSPPARGEAPPGGAGSPSTPGEGPPGGAGAPPARGDGTPGGAGSPSARGGASVAAYSSSAGAGSRVVVTGASGSGDPWIVSGGGAIAISEASVAPGARLVDRVRVIVAQAAAADPLRNDLRPPAVRHAARALIAAMVDGLPRLSEPAGDTIAARLWSRLCPEPPEPARLHALNAALVLLADHELGISALAARVAASAWADPYLVVLAGLSALGGPLHGGAPGAVERLLGQIREPREVAAALGARLAAGEPLPGFGHKVYRARDPRADLLLELLEEAQPERLPLIREVLGVVTRHDGPFPNVDLALGALSDAFGFVPGAAEAIFAVSRSAGFIAHALEEYPYRLRFRTRAAYTGPPPAGR